MSHKQLELLSSVLIHMTFALFTLQQKLLASAGVCADLLKANLQIPILGVCMGMQALAVAFGASIQHAPEPIHGRVSQIQHTDHKLFHKIPSGMPCCACTPQSIQLSWVLSMGYSSLMRRPLLGSS